MRRNSRRLSLLLTAAALVAVAGCGDDADTNASTAGSESAAAETERPDISGTDAQPVGKSSAGSVVQFADCDDWNGGTVDERRATVVAIRGQLTPQESKTAASPLSDERAYEIFEKACSPDYAGPLRLYKLYARAQGFAPLNVP